MTQTVEYLDPEIANEGESIDNWQPFVAAPVIPDYKGLKSIAKYFPQYSGIPYKHKPFPAWLYHPTLDPVLARTAEIAKEKYGVEWRKATFDERARGLPDYIWDYSGDTQWRSIPYAETKDRTSHTGKTLVLQPAAAPSQAEMVSAVVAAVIAQMGAGAGSGPRNALAGPVADDPDYAEFLEFKKWKAAQQPSGGDGILNENGLTAQEEKRLLIDAAKERGIEIDGRWSVERIKDELAKYAD